MPLEADMFYRGDVIYWEGVVYGILYRCLFSGTALLSTWKSTSDTVTQAHRPLHLSTHGRVRNISQFQSCGFGSSWRYLPKIFPWQSFAYWRRPPKHPQLQPRWSYITELWTGEGEDQGVTTRCRLSWLTNSALVYESQCGGMGGGGCGVPANEYSCAHHVT
jgi:hypothetical protein